MKYILFLFKSGLLIIALCSALYSSADDQANEVVLIWFVACSTVLAITVQTFELYAKDKDERQAQEEMRNAIKNHSEVIKGQSEIIYNLRKSLFPIYKISLCIKKYVVLKESVSDEYISKLLEYISNCEYKDDYKDYFPGITSDDNGLTKVHWNSERTRVIRLSINRGSQLMPTMEDSGAKCGLSSDSYSIAFSTNPISTDCINKKCPCFDSEKVDLIMWCLHIFPEYELNSIEIEYVRKPSDHFTVTTTYTKYRIDHDSGAITSVLDLPNCYMAVLPRNIFNQLSNTYDAIMSVDIICEHSSGADKRRSFSISRSDFSKFETPFPFYVYKFPPHEL